MKRIEIKKLIDQALNGTPKKEATIEQVINLENRVKPVNLSQTQQNQYKELIKKISEFCDQKNLKGKKEIEVFQNQALEALANPHFIYSDFGKGFIKQLFFTKAIEAILILVDEQLKGIDSESLSSAVKQTIELDLEDIIFPQNERHTNNFNGFIHEVGEKINIDENSVMRKKLFKVYLISKCLLGQIDKNSYLKMLAKLEISHANELLEILYTILKLQLNSELENILEVISMISSVFYIELNRDNKSKKILLKVKEYLDEIVMRKSVCEDAKALSNLAKTDFIKTYSSVIKQNKNIIYFDF